MRRCLITLLALGTAGCRPKNAHARDSDASPVEVPSDAPARIPPPAMPTPPSVPAPQPVSSDLPGDARAAAAAVRTRPELEAALKEKGLRLGDPVFIRIFKEERVLELWIRHRDTGKYDFFRSWPVAAMSGNPGPKLIEGDGQAPEGFYVVNRERMKPDSQFHLAFNIGYPNAYDIAHGRNGTFLMVHGNEVSIGCFAMTDLKIEEIYTLCDAALKKGQPFFRVHCFPFRMTSERMAAAAGDPWEDFWLNLKEGYDRFESDHVPPEVDVVDKRYVIRRSS